MSIFASRLTSTSPQQAIQEVRDAMNKQQYPKARKIATQALTGIGEDREASFTLLMAVALATHHIPEKRADGYRLMETSKRLSGYGDYKLQYIQMLQDAYRHTGQVDDRRQLERDYSFLERTERKHRETSPPKKHFWSLRKTSAF